MTQELSTDIQGIVDETKELISFGQKVVLQVSANVVKLREELFPEKKDHKEFVQWCYKELGIKASQTSKYESIGDYYFLDGQYTPESFLTDGKYRDYEVVYASTKLPGTREENFAHALTWGRDDFKTTRRAGNEEPNWLAYFPEKISRVEVIDHTKPLEEGGGRAYTFRQDNVKVSLQLQDDSMTLKVFIEPNETNPTQA